MSAKKRDEEIIEEVEAEVVVEEPEATVEEIQKRIAALKADRIKNQSAEHIKALLNQVPKSKTAKQLGVPPMDYALRVMASQSDDINVVPHMLGIARARKAMKNQGYGLEEVDKVVTKLEEVYKV